MFDLKKFGLLVKYERMRRGFTQLQFAMSLNISTSFLCQIECAKKIPSAEIVVLILNSLLLSVEECNSFFDKKTNSVIHKYEEQLSQLKNEDCEYIYNLLISNK